MRVFILVIFMCLSTFCLASRERGFFFGGGFTYVDVGVEDFFENGVKFKSLELASGYKFNDYLGVDVRYGMSPSKETYNAGVDPNTRRRVSNEAELDYYSSYYYRPELAGEVAKLYLLIGQSTVSVIREDQNGVFTTETASGNSYGVGFGLWINRRFDVTIEYRQLLQTEFDTFTSNGINVEYRF